MGFSADTALTVDADLTKFAFEQQITNLLRGGNTYGDLHRGAVDDLIRRLRAQGYTTVQMAGITNADDFKPALVAWVLSKIFAGQGGRTPADRDGAIGKAAFYADQFEKLLKGTAVVLADATVHEVRGLPVLVNVDEGTMFPALGTGTLGATLHDGTHGILSPSVAVWGTLTATVSTVLQGQGLAAGAIYVGRQADPNSVSDGCAVIRTQQERQQGGAANNAERWVFPVEVEFRFVVVDPDGNLQKALVELWQRRLESALHEKHASDFPSIAGLESVRVEMTTKDTAGSRDQDDGGDEVRARAVVKFAIWRAR